MWPGAFRIEKPGVVAVMRGGCGRKLEIAFSDVEWFIREGWLWRRRRERVEEVCWTGPETRETLARAGLSRVRAWDAVRFFKSDPNTRPAYRTFYLARKTNL